MKKKCLIVVALLLMAFLGAVIVFVANLGNMLKARLERSGAEHLGVTVTVDSVDIKLFKGTAALNGLVIKNPEGFMTPHAVRIDALTVEMDFRSLTSDTVIIHEIRIDAPELMLELGLEKVNVGALMKNAEKATAATTKSAGRRSDPDDRAGEKHVSIHSVLVNGGHVGLSSRVQQGEAIMMPLPDIAMENIGHDDAGIGLADALSVILKTIYNHVAQVVASSGNLTGEMLLSFGGITLEKETGLFGAIGAELGSEDSTPGDGAGEVIESRDGEKAENE